MSVGNVRDLWTRPQRNQDGRPALDTKGKPLREKTERWGKGKRWLATWDENGKRVSRAYTHKDAAEDAAARVRVDTIDGTHITRDKAAVTLTQMWTTWIAAKADRAPSTVAGYEAAWKHIEPKFGHRACRTITDAEVAAWIPTLRTTWGAADGQTKPLGAATKRKVGVVINALLEVAFDEKVIPRNPIKARTIPAQDETRRRYLTVPEVDALLARATEDDPRSRRFVEVLLFAGPRPGEVGPIDCADLDVRRGRIRIHKTKNRRARDVPVGGDLLKALEQEADGRGGDEPLLRAPRGGRWTKSAWESLWDRIGVEGVTLYELRHTAASMAIAAGADVKTVQAMLGHQSAAQTLDTYSHLWHDNLDMVPGAVQVWMQAQRDAAAEPGANRERTDGQ